MLLIGLCGRAQVGKDTIGAYLIKHHGFKRFGIADYVKQVAELAGWNGIKDERGRTYLNHIGDAMREYDPEIMLKHLVTKIKYYEHICEQNGMPDVRVVITDARMEPEMRWIKSVGGSLWLVLRDVEDQSIPAHATEKADKVDRSMFEFVFENNGSFSSLYSGVHQAIEATVKNVKS